jgi:hypothetical protein
MSRLANLSLCAVLLPISVGSLSCTESEATFYFKGIITPEIEEDEMTRTILCNPEGDTLQSRWNVTELGGEACLQIVNQMIKRGDPDVPRAETNTILVYEVDVVIEKDGIEIGAFTQATTVFVDPAGSTGFFVPVVDADTYEKLDPGDGAVAFVIAKGRTTSGRNLETPEFSVPIYK